MGNVNEKQILKRYWKNSDIVKDSVTDDKHVRKCFSAYDKNKSGALEKEEAIMYIKDLLRISGYITKIKTDSEKIKIDFESHFDEYAEFIFSDMCGASLEGITFSMFWKPKKKFWEKKFTLIRSQIIHRHKPKKKKKSKVKYIEEQEDQMDEAFDDSEEEFYEDKRNELRDSNLKNLRISHKALTLDEINNLRKKKVNDVQEVLDISYHAAQGLLAYFKWDKERLLESYVENPEEICKKAGIPYPPPKRVENNTKPSKMDGDIKDGDNNDNNDENETFECPVCFCDVTEWTASPSCGHRFCNDCWGYNLELQIKEGHTIDIHCMEKGCNSLISDDMIKPLVSKEIYEKYTKFLSQKFIDLNSDIKWCPSPGCNKVTEKTYMGFYPVGKCSCGNQFCFLCLEECHFPLTCEELIAWKKLSDESLINAKWLYENTKPCPGCKTPIEKNDGCFQMTCFNCRKQFCWLCLDDWSTHSNHFQCAKYQNQTVQNKPIYMEEHEKPDFIDQVVDSFYFVRYQEYERSLKLESEHWKTTETKISKLKSFNSSVDASFLIKAHKILQRSRRLLKYTFASLGLHSKTKENHFYRAFVESLEIIVEKLAQLSERENDFENMDRAQIRKLIKLAKNSVSNFFEYDQIEV